MDRVGVREMRQNLSRYTARVRHGESFLITERGQEIAKLVPVEARASAVDRLVADRGARRAEAPLLDLLAPLPAPAAGATLSELLGEQRADR